MKEVGIIETACSFPKHFIETKDLAEKRGIPPKRFTEGLIIEKIAICDKDETVVTLGTAAISKLLRKARVSPKEITQIWVATESSIDETKPLGTFIIGELHKLGYDFSHCGTIELKFACIAGTYALMFAYDYLQIHPKEKVIVLCVDEAKYELESAAEGTQGAGAIAFLMGTENLQISLDFSKFGIYTGDIYDFFRPFGQEIPTVNGKFSEYAYLLVMKHAYDDLKEKLKRKRPLINKVDWIIFHIPYPKMVMHALSFLLRHDFRDTKIWGKILKEIGETEEPPIGILELAYNEDFRQQDKAFRKKLMETPWFQKIVSQKMEPSLIASRQTGNLYTGSLYLALLSLLEYGNPKKGQKIGLGSYGSGAGGIVFIAIIKNAKKPGLEKELARRTKITIEEYEALRGKK